MDAELTGRDLLGHVAGLGLAILVWAVESYEYASRLVVDPTWTAVGVVTGLALFATVTFSAVGRRFQHRLRESTRFAVAVLALGLALVVLVVAVVDVHVRPAHFSWFLGLGLGQLVGVGLALRQRAAG
jgi:hypothetical protein